MNLFSSNEISTWDKVTLKNQNISEIQLIDRATDAFLEAFFIITEASAYEDGIICICGNGNNGADGLSIASKLFHKGYNITVWNIDPTKNNSDANQYYFNQLAEGIEILDITPSKDNFLPEVDANTIFIDALFGVGISGELSQEYLGLIDDINNYSNYKVAVDIPSGMKSDLIVSEQAIICELCITFELPKISFFLEENMKFYKAWVEVEIGLDDEFYYRNETKFTFYNERDAFLDLPLRKADSYKNNYGHVLLCSGSKGKIGSAILTSRAILKSGCGLLTIHAPQCAYHILQTSVPEAMVSLDPSLETISCLPNIDSYDVIAIGPGLGTSQKAKDFLYELLQTYTGYLVMDADALNLLSEHENWSELLSEKHILLPHAGEFDRLFGKSENQLERIDKIKNFIKNCDATVVLKGPSTITAQKNNGINFNYSGNPGMATAGSGDVLTGIVASLIAQLKSPTYATRLAVYIHGLAGDKYVELESEESLIASDIIQNLGKAYRTIKFFST